MKKVLSIVMVVALAASVASASLTRISGLGIDGWMIEDDDSLVMYNPARVVDYSDIMWGEWDDVATNGWGGLSGNLGLMDITGALFVGQGYNGAIGNLGSTASGTDVPAASWLPTFTSRISLSNVNEKFDVILGKSLSNMNAGISVNYASASNSKEEEIISVPIATSDTKTEEDFSASDIGLTLGAQMSDMGSFSSVDAIVSLNMLSAENTYTRDNYDGITANKYVRDYDLTFESDNGMNMGLMVRGIMDKSADSKMLFNLSYDKEDISSVSTEKINSNPTINDDYADAGDTNHVLTREDTTSEISLGIAKNKMLSEDTLMIAAAGLSLETVTQEESRDIKKVGAVGVQEEYNREAKTTQIPLNFAIEHNISKVLTVRTGVNYTLYNKETVTIDNPNGGSSPTGQEDDEEINDNATGVATLTMGLGINPVEDLTVDAVIEQGVTGAGMLNQLASQLTATWKY
ncbi:MAG: hypothetical protein PF545_01500 [Elusimicrobia bacterium]|jgi:hypothetical protein|nr:hypothetical protein [Elusimicrobiota bacterium]